MKETSLAIDGIYGWGIGFYSWELSDKFDKVVSEFCKNNNLPITEESSNGRCCCVGKFPENSIYFHAMDTVFSGEYNQHELIQDFCKLLTENFTCKIVIKEYEK